MDNKLLRVRQCGRTVYVIDDIADPGDEVVMTVTLDSDAPLSERDKESILEEYRRRKRIPDGKVAKTAFVDEPHALKEKRQRGGSATLCSSEDEEQAAVIEYCNLRGIPVVHIPNEGKRSLSFAARLKRLGMRPGFPDLFIPRARGSYHGLFIEMKYGKGKTTKEQEEWLALLQGEGYATAVCYSSLEAINAINAYERRGTT